MSLRTGSFAVLTLGLLVSAAHAKESAMGVLIVPALDKDLALADNLTEVAMARMAETPGRTLVGTLELRQRAGAEAGRNIHGCLETPACLGNVAVSIGVSRLVTGAVRTEGEHFLLSLSLTDVAAGRVDARFFRQVDGGVADLIRAVQDGVDELLRPRARPGRLRVRSQPDGAQVAVDEVYRGRTPLIAAALEPGAHRVRVELDQHFPWSASVEVPPGGDVHINLGPHDLRPRRRWAPYVVYGSAIGAALCLSAGGVFGTLAEIAPTGRTRQEAQRDLHRRQTYGRVGTTLLVSGTVLSLVSAAVLARHWPELTQ